MNRETFINFVRSQIGRPYRWGGQSSDEGYDCGGLVIGGMRAVYGNYEDLSASGLATKYHAFKCLVSGAKPGCLLFYGQDPTAIVHVMIVLDVWKYTVDIPKMVLVGSRGGDKSTIDLDMAWTQRAYVATMLGDYWWSNFQLCVDPFSQEG